MIESSSFTLRNTIGTQRVASDPIKVRKMKVHKPKQYRQVGEEMRNIAFYADLVKGGKENYAEDVRIIAVAGLRARYHRYM